LKSGNIFYMQILKKLPYLKAFTFFFVFVLYTLYMHIFKQFSAVYVESHAQTFATLFSKVFWLAAFWHFHPPVEWFANIMTKL